MLRLTHEAVGKRPSAALPSSLVTAVYFYVRLVPRDFGSLASGHFPSASQMPVFDSFTQRILGQVARKVFLMGEVSTSWI
jgi:hypothetical protein